MDKKIIHTVFEQVVENHPHKIAVQDAHGELSYQKLNSEANQLAQWLRSLHIEKGDIVGVMVTPGITLIKSLLAILKAGGIYLPVDVNFPRNKIQQIFNDCVPKVVFIDEENMVDLQHWVSTLDVTFQYAISYGKHGLKLYKKQGIDMVPQAADVSSFPDQNLPVISGKDDGNYIFYTSGSTGEAKAILGRQMSLGHFIDWEIKEFALDETNHCSMLSQFTFDASLRDVFVALCTGSTLHIPTADIKNNTVQLLDWLVDHKISLIHTVPSVFKLLTKELPNFDKKEALVNQLNHVLMAGEPLYVRDITTWRQHMGTEVEIVNLYGTSETTLAKTFHRINDVGNDPGQVIHVGHSISHTQVMVMNGSSLCSTGEIGEIYIRTPFMSKGYFNNKTLAETVFIQNPLEKEQKDIVHRTGDFGRYLPDGALEVLGRKDDQVKVNGIRVELGEVICRVRELEAIEDVDVVAMKNEMLGNDLVCYYTGVFQETAVLQGLLKDRLTQSIIPSFFVHLDEFPLTMNGKKDKKAYPKPETVLNIGEAYEAPVGEVEKKLEEMWIEILGMKQIDRNVSFFKLGGNSMKVIQLISRIYREYETIFKYIDIFENHSIQSLAKLIAKSQIGKKYEAINKVAESEYHELSLSQHQLYVASQFDNNQIAYNIPVSYIFEGKLDTVAFKKAFETLVARHESLRTIFPSIDGKPKQKINSIDEHQVVLTLLDLTTKANAHTEAEVLANEQATTIFDLAKDALIKASLMKIGEEKYVFALTMHHIISDGWSMNVIIYELLTMYNAFKSETDHPLKPLRIQYKDYAAWQHKSLSDHGSAKNSKGYWLSKFEGDIPVLELPLDYERPEFVDYKGSSKNFIIDRKRTLAIKKICEDAEATMFMFLLSVVNVLLLKQSGQKDIILGSPIAGRPHRDLEDQIGFYVNMLALRTQTDIDEPFKKLLLDTKTNTLEAYDHELYPFHQLVEDLNLKADFSRNNLFDVVVQFQNAKLENVKDLQLDGVEVSNFLPNSYSSKFDITFNFEELEDEKELSLDIEFKSSLFKSETIDRLYDDLIAVVDLVVDDPNRSVKNIRDKVVELNTKVEDSAMADMLSGTITADY